MPEDKALTPAEERTIVFYDDELTAVRLEGGEIYVPVRRLCDNLGLSWAGQRERINRDDVLSQAVRSVRVTRPDLSSKFAPEAADMTCLPLDLIPGWLFGIQPSRVRPEIRDKLGRYRRECFKVLWDAFKTEVLPAVDPALTADKTALTPAEQALTLAEAVVSLARQQVALERFVIQQEAGLALAHNRLDKAAEVVGEHEQRLRRIELALAGGQKVSDEQAAMISEAVKALAFELGRAEPDKGNAYQRVYAELYRKFKVPSYRAIPFSAFPRVMDWLTEWWQRVNPEPPPFGNQ